MSSSRKYAHWLYAGFYGGLQKLSVPISGLFITMILAHKTLNKQEMGVWALFMTITAIIESVRQGMVKTALIRYYNHGEESRDKVVGAAFFLNLCVTIILSVLMFVFCHSLATWLKAPQLEQMLYILQAGMLLKIPFSHFEWLMYAKVQFKGLFWTYFFRQGLTLLLVFVAFISGFRLTLNNLAVIYNLGLLAGVLTSSRFVQEWIRRSFRFSREWIMRLFHFGKYVFANNMSSLVFRSADQVMLSPILGSTEFNASQNISVRFINLTDLPSQTLGDILFPKASQLSGGSTSTLKYYYEKTVGASLVVVIPVMIMVLLLPKFIIYILAGPDYYDAIPYLQLISVTSIFLAYLKQFGVLMDSTGRPGLNFASNSIIAVLQVTLLYFCIKHYGFIGTGYALVLSHIAGFILTQYLLYKYFRINFLNAFRYAWGFVFELPVVLLQKIRKK